jgi:predicted metal-binding membrane protein
MTESALTAVLRRDRTIVAVSLLALCAIAWAYVLWLVQAMHMGGMQMTGVRVDANPFEIAMIASVEPWSAAEFAFAFVMWAVMMVGMMTPSAAPMILIYARVGRQAELQGKPLAATGYFAGGYLLAWTAFALAATAGQWLLERASLLTPMMASASDILGGLVLVAAGLYQWTPVKDVCLKHCQAPLLFIQRHGGFRRDRLGSLGIGLRHGLYCIGCCWALMALLFVGGVMNVLWIAGIAVFVLAEKVMLSGRTFSRIGGVLLIAVGVWLIVEAHIGA